MNSVEENAQHASVLDPAGEQLGKIYAKALIGAAAKAGIADTVVADLGSLVDDCLSKNPALAEVLASPRVSDTEKERVIDRLFSDKLNPVLVRFLKVMAQRGRLGHVADVRQAAEVLQDEMQNRVIAEVRTAVPLDSSTRENVINRLQQSLNKTVRLKEIVDPQLLGGMVVRVGDTVFDGSVANQIDKLTQKVRAGFSSELLKRFESFASSDSTSGT